MTTRRIIVKGVVQMVGYRAFTIDLARRLGLTGYTRNLPDDTVEVVAQGEEGALNALIDELRVGPRAAYVTGVEIEILPPGEIFERFEIRY